MTWLRLLAVLSLCLSMSAVAAEKRADLLLYCGITMVRPMTEIARAFEQRAPVRIAISQGGSEDLYQSAKKSRVGDWYLPGEPSYRDRHLKEGLLGEAVTVGYNQIALVVAKGNPKRIKPDPRELLRKDVVAIIGSHESGSVGLESRQLLEAIGIYPQVVDRVAFLAPDSRSLMIALKKGEADVALNWRATGFFPDTASLVDVVDLDPALARPQALLLNLLNSSREPVLAKQFMAFAAGPEGQAIFRRHGFLDAKAGKK